MPSERTVYTWLFRNIDPEFTQNYARAREAQQDYVVDESMEIADTATPETVHVARLRIDQRKWQAGKLAPVKYGDATLLKHANHDGTGPVIVRVPSVEPDSATWQKKHAPEPVK